MGHTEERVVDWQIVAQVTYGSYSGLNGRMADSSPGYI